MTRVNCSNETEWKLGIGDQDHSYKQIFSHPPVVEDLLRSFVLEPWVQQVDFRTLEKVSGSYVSADLRDREDDLIWRVRWGGLEWLYVYLLLEFQSKVYVQTETHFFDLRI